MSDQPGGLAPQHQPHPLAEGMAWIVASAPGMVIVQIFDATGSRVLFFAPDDAATFIRQVKEQMHRARSGLIVPGGGIDHVNGNGS